jgi:hypothetical protein
MLYKMNIPQTCDCGETFTIDHAMIYHTGGFPKIRCNKIHDITASLLTEVCHNVATEPPLQPLSGEALTYRTANSGYLVKLSTHRTANSEDGARLDIRARGFWNRALDAFIDVKIFHPNASSYLSMSLQAAFRHHEQSQEERIRGRCA